MAVVALECICRYGKEFVEMFDGANCHAGKMPFNASIGAEDHEAPRLPDLRKQIN